MWIPKVNQISIKDALKREKSKFQRRIWNAHILKGKTFHELNKLAESVVKGNLDGLRERTNYYRIREICPMLQRGMVRAKTAVIHRLCPVSTVHPWMVCFDLLMPHEVFDFLNKEILSPTRFGIELEDTQGLVIMIVTFSNLRRSSNVFDQFKDCGSNLVKDNERQSWLWTPRRREQWSTMLNSRFSRAESFLRILEFVSDSQSTMNRGCKVEP